MRLTSDFWVSALIRKVQGDGGFAYLARRGSKEAGAIFIKISSRFGTCDLYSPAPQTSYEEISDGERLFCAFSTMSMILRSVNGWNGKPASILIFG